MHGSLKSKGKKNTTQSRVSNTVPYLPTCPKPNVGQNRASGNGKRKRKAETEKLKFGNGRQKFNRLVSGRCAHRCIVVCMSRVTLTYMPN